MSGSDAALPTLPAGCNLLVYDRLGSSNDEAKRLARAGAASGTIVWAREQTAGRGRRGRIWVAVPGNLYASIILRPDCPPAAAAQLAFLAALGLGEAAGEFVGATAELRYKWPNDVLLDGGKLAGILCEAAMGAEARLDWAIVGIGVNLAGHPPVTDFPATSLAAAGRPDVTGAMMLESLLRRFFGWVERWRREGFAPAREAWIRGARGLGEPLVVRLEREAIAGRFAGLDGDGALLLATAAGERRITAGDIFPAAG